jgi:hypothetical protein
VDAIIVVVRLGVVNRPMLRDLARELDASPANKLGFVLTGAGSAELYGAGGYAYRAALEPSKVQEEAGTVPSLADVDEDVDERRSAAGRSGSLPRS